jgi:enoyl-[acyl-carrier protein] reductase/trans-2-enoyl-CoA reductase (NAD+)
MKQAGIHEGCIEQTTRLFSTQLFSPDALRLDDENRIRMDDLELTPEIQAYVKENWTLVTNETLSLLTDFEGYRQAFLEMHGFAFDGVDYEAEVEPVKDMDLAFGS